MQKQKLVRKDLGGRVSNARPTENDTFKQRQQTVRKNDAVEGEP